jgi:carboxymethylenebutenolidase
MAHSQPQGYLALPSGGKGPGVLVLHAWWGLNETIKSICRRLAESGFVAFAPDLYHGKVAETIPDAEALGSIVDANYLQAKAEVAEAAKYLSEQVEQINCSLAVVGFSLGAFFALDLSASDPDRIRSVVLFYGTEGSMGTDFSSSRAAYLGHFAENDPYESKTNVDNLEQSLRGAGRPVTFYHYPGTGHWFFEPDRTDVYNPAAASLAWERTLAFLKSPIAI